MSFPLRVLGDLFCLFEMSQRSLSGHATETKSDSMHMRRSWPKANVKRWPFDFPQQNGATKMCDQPWTKGSIRSQRSTRGLQGPPNQRKMRTCRYVVACVPATPLVRYPLIGWITAHQTTHPNPVQDEYSRTLFEPLSNPTLVV